MRKSGRGEISPTRSWSAGGAGSPVIVVITAFVRKRLAVAGQPAVPRSVDSRHERSPAPSETTPARPSFSAASWIISSPPTEKPIPPMRPSSTSGRSWR